MRWLPRVTPWRVPVRGGLYYCAVGTHNVEGCELGDGHFEICVNAGIDMTGINAEVIAGQWVFQCFDKGAKRGKRAFLVRADQPALKFVQRLRFASEDLEDRRETRDVEDLPNDLVEAADS